MTGALVSSQVYGRCLFFFLGVLPLIECNALVRALVTLPPLPPPIDQLNEAKPPEPPPPGGPWAHWRLNYGTG